MPLAPSEYTLELTPSSRVDVIDVRTRVNDRFGGALDAYKRVLCCSFHTTAGYLDQSLASRLNQSRMGVMPYIDLFRTMFPEGAGDEHDRRARRRGTSVIGYSQEEPVAQARLTVPVSRFAVDSVNLKAPTLGIYEECAALVAAHGVTKGR